jgi:pimeloyl-ACP methyl ester carboxylesterase
MTDLNDFCATGTTWREEMISVAPNMSLKLYTFSGPEQKRGPDILFVAGWVSLIEGWKEVLKEMTRWHRVYYIETREKISSAVQGKAAYGVFEIGQDIVRVADKLNLDREKYIMFGSSLGATVLLDCYQNLKNKPICMILVGPNALFRVPATWKFIVKIFYPPLYEIIKPSVKWYLRTFRLNVKADYEQYEKYSRALDSGDPWKLKKAVLALSSYEVWDVLPQIDCPVLVFGASRDKLHEPDNLKRIVSLLPEASYIDMETNKHTHSKDMVDRMEAYINKIKAEVRF